MYMYVCICIMCQRVGATVQCTTNHKHERTLRRRAVPGVGAAGGAHDGAVGEADGKDLGSSVGGVRKCVVRHYLLLVLLYTARLP